MENEKNKRFRDNRKDANPSMHATAPAPPAEVRNLGAFLAIRERYYELLEEWFKAGHITLPSEVELLYFLEGEL